MGPITVLIGLNRRAPRHGCEGFYLLVAGSMRMRALNVAARARFGEEVATAKVRALLVGR